MDLSLYLSELLSKQSVVYVPGLGRFESVRAGAHYNSNEGRFYPPHYTIAFEQRKAENNGFAEYISQKKAISISSAKYFIEKYVQDVLTETAVGEVKVGNLGWLVGEGTGIAFRANPQTGSNSAFYGYPVLALHPLGHRPAPTPQIPDLSLSFTPEKKQPEPQPSHKAEPVTPAPVIEQQVYNDEEEYVEKRGVNIWMIILGVVVLLAAAATGIFLYKPSLFAGATEQPKPLPAPALSDAQTTGDSTATDSIQPKESSSPVLDSNVQLGSVTSKVSDTLGKVQPQVKRVVDEVAETKAAAVKDTRTRYEIQAGAFKTIEKATGDLTRFARAGIDAKVVEIPGNWQIVSLGTYFTREEAVKAQNKLVADGKIKNGQTIIKSHTPKK